MHKKPGRCGKSGDWPFLKRKLTRKHPSHPSPPSTTYHNTKSEALQSTSAAAPPQFCNTLPQAIRCLATAAVVGVSPYRRIGVSIARRRFVVLRRRASSLRKSSPHLVSIARRRFVVLRLGESLSKLAYNVVVSIARRRFVVLRRGPTRACGSGAREFQSPAGDSLSCDRRPLRLRPRRPTLVSIARRRFVVLRHPRGRGQDLLVFGFNRPQAIRCLATDRTGSALVRGTAVSYTHLTLPTSDLV